VTVSEPGLELRRAKMHGMLTDERDAVDAPAPPPAGSRGPAPWQVVVVVLALCFLAGVAGWWLNEPEHDSFNSVDVGFLADMETHHNGAINLSFDYLDRSHDPVVKHFAQEIIGSQSQELAAMNSYLNRAGGASAVTGDDVAMEWMGHPVRPADMPGMPTKAELAELDAAQGLTADDVFTRLMIHHHAGGIAMAEYAAEHGEHPGVRRFAASMARVQRTEIDEMNNRRVALGLSPVPQSEIEALEHVHAS
jgi:uncharacterized protein (DUF305 family)